MRRAIAILVLLWTPVLALGQTVEEDRGFLVGLLEDNLSGIGREVRVIGFAGALSARATIEELTVADTDGVWFTLKGAVLDWDRSALLRGELKIAELSAEEILISRRPMSEATLPSPEASGFSLPELPGSVNIEKLAVTKVTLGAPLFGEAAVVSFDGSMRLAAGAGNTSFAVKRIDDAIGALSFAGAYSNVTRELELALTLSEADDGIVANLLDLPGLPSVTLSLKGAAPIDDFTADVSLATAGEDRLSGQIFLASQLETEDRDGPSTRIFKADVSGDVTPVFAPAYRPFFGPNIRLKIDGNRQSDGRVNINDLNLSADGIALSGRLALGSEGWPESFDIQGRIAADDGRAILLPLSGQETFVDLAEIQATYDAALGEEWSGRVALTGFAQADLKLDDAVLMGSGTLERGDGASVGEVHGDLRLEANGIASPDTAFSRAVGETLSGSLNFDWVEDAPFEVSQLSLAGDDYGLTGTVTFEGLQDRLNLTASGETNLTAADLSRFSGLAGVPLGGSARLDIAGSGTFLSGAFDANIEGTTRNLGVGQPRVDPLLLGTGSLFLDVSRDINGTRIDRLDIATPQLKAIADGTLKTDGSTFRFDTALRDLSQIFPDVNGEASLRGTVSHTGDLWNFGFNGTGPGGIVTEMSGTATGDGVDKLVVDGEAHATIEDLGPYSAIAERRLTGSALLHLEGRGDILAKTFNANADITGSNLGVGQTHLDQLLAGNSTLLVEARSEQAGQIVFDRLDLKTPEITADMTGSVGETRNRLRFYGWMRDLGLFAEGLSGPLTAEGVIEKTGSNWQVDASGTGLGGVTAKATGTVSEDGSEMDLAFDGTAPLALANRYIRPRTVDGLARFDLAVNGPPTVSSLSGTIRTQDASIVVPNQRIAFGNVNATAGISGGSAQINVRSNVSTGGQARLAGSIGLSPSLPADLKLALTNIGISEGRLYETTADGDITMVGPLAGGAAIRGELDLDAVELRLTESGSSAISAIPDMQHLNEPVAVRQTRNWAGLISEGDAATSAGIPYPVDLLIRAPARIFVRGRGLDAELGGQLRLRGTTAELAPEGQFDLIRGRIEILGKRLTLTEGFAQLQGNFDPYIRFVADTNAEDVSISIVVEGLASAPNVTFQSSPELPEDEVLSLLLFGREITKISAFQAAQLAAAINTLVGKGGGGLVNRLRDQFGLDDLDITTPEDGAVGARVGKYITENIYSEITIDAEGKSEINLNLTISPTVTARGKLDSDGDTSLGVFVEKDY